MKINNNDEYDSQYLIVINMTIDKQFCISYCSGQEHC